MVLLEVLLGLGYRRLTVCHLNHGLRGPASGQDAAFVRRLADRHGLPAIVEKEDVARRARDERVSVETAARHARLAFFARCARTTHCRIVFLGHHADDQAETILMNLCRGSGLGGVSGMSESTTIRENGVRLVMIRPMLSIPRSEIDTFAAAHGVAYREDATNAEEGNFRNRLRNRILPELKKAAGRDVSGAIVRAGEICAAEDALLNTLASAVPLEAELSTTTVGATPVALQRRILHRWLESRGVRDIGFRAVEAVRGLLEVRPGRGAKVNLPNGLHARRRAGKLFVE